MLYFTIGYACIGHSHVKWKHTHLNAISEDFGHRTLTRSYHPSSPSGSYETKPSNTESPEVETISESCPSLPAAFTSVSGSPYNSRRVKRRQVMTSKIVSLVFRLV